MRDITAIYPGTFDPITYGHIDIIKRASKIFNRIIIAPALDNAKTPLFSLDERVQIIHEEITCLVCADKLEVIPFRGLLVDFAKVQGASVLVRGLRAASDFEFEFQLAYMNHKLDGDIETIFIPANEKGHFISSSFVKQIAKLNGDVSNFVSANVERKLRRHYDV